MVLKAMFLTFLGSCFNVCRLIVSFHCFVIKGPKINGTGMDPKTEKTFFWLFLFIFK